MLNPFFNLPLKIIAFVAAVILWFAVEMEREFTYELALPLRVSGLRKEYEIADSIPSYISVGLLGKGKDLIKVVLKPGYIELKGDRLKYGRRVYVIKESDIKLASTNVKVVKIGPPEELSFFVDEHTQKEVYVGAKAVIIPSDGYIQEGELKVTPSTVIATGPATILRMFDSVFTAPETIKGLSSSYSTTLPLKPPSPKARLIPSTVNVSVEVARIVEKEFENIPVVASSRRERSKKILLNPKVVSVVVAGSEKKLKSLDERSINVFVDVPDSFGSDNKIKPFVVLPSGIRLVKVKPDSIAIMKR